MKCFKYLIQQFENLITFCRMIVWWTLVFVIAPGWAGESKSVPPQSNPVSTACKQIDDNVVEEWKKKVKNFQESLPKMATRGGLDDISSPLFFPITSSKVVKILSGQRKIHLAWESGEKPYRVKVSLNGDIWFEEPDLQETKVSLVENKEFKASENHRFAVIDSRVVRK
jgi:exosome complex RNA-binding protein Rrp4